MYTYRFTGFAFSVLVVSALSDLVPPQATCGTPDARTGPVTQISSVRTAANTVRGGGALNDHFLTTDARGAWRTFLAVLREEAHLKGNRQNCLI